MPFSTTRAAILWAATAALVAGCNQAGGSSDRQVQLDLSNAYAAAAGGDDKAADEALNDAVKLTSASPEMRAVAKSALARRQLTATYKLMGQVQGMDLQLSRLVSQATLLAQQVRGGGTAIAAYKEYDPKPISEAIAQKVAEVQGSAEKSEWMKEQGAMLPTLTAATQNVVKTQGEIAQLQEQKKNLEAEQSKLMADAAAASAQSENSKGKESVDAYDKGSDLRKQAAEKAVELDKLAVQILRQQADLTIAQSTQATLQEAVAQLQQDGTQRETNWKQVDTDVTQRKEFAAKILGPEDAPDTIGAMGKQIDDLAKQIADVRGQAESAANDAIKYYQDANKDAEEARRAVQVEIGDPKNAGRPTLVAMKDLVEAVAPLKYKFQEGAAERALGTLYTSEATSLGRRIALKDATTLAATSIGGTVPPSIEQGDLANERQTKLTLADAAFKNSESAIGDVLDGTASEDLKASARISRVLTYYNWSLLNKAAGDEKAAADHLAAAVTDRNAAAEGQLALPALPADLGAVPSPSTAPAANG